MGGFGRYCVELSTRVPWRSFVGIGAFGLIVVGIWGLAGWAWAAIAAGAPPATFYAIGEWRAANRPPVT